MKKMLAGLLIVLVLVAGALMVAMLSMTLAGDGSEKKQITSLEDYADPEIMDSLDNVMKKNEARRNGDTYCERCDKFIEGKVRICPYCGEYI